MNRFTVTSLILIFNVLILSDCASDSETPDQIAMKFLISKPWKIQNVEVDGVDRTLVYKDLSITFSEKSFTSLNGNAIWPASGSWSFIDNDGKIIKRDDNLEITLLDVSSEKLSLSLNWNERTLGGGKFSSVVGTHKFVFSH